LLESCFEEEKRFGVFFAGKWLWKAKKFGVFFLLAIKDYKSKKTCSFKKNDYSLAFMRLR
jgi:hypothetical protein